MCVDLEAELSRAVGYHRHHRGKQCCRHKRTWVPIVKNIIIYRKAEQARVVVEWMKRWPQLTAMAAYLLILPGDVPDPPAQVLQAVCSSAPRCCASPPPAQEPVRHMFSSEEGKDRVAGERWAWAGQRHPRPWLGDRRPAWLGKRRPAAGR